ncbi:hypothetical protein SFRURICE_006883 [Spodoptera frugiperda]|nr:hypothetical protein SFRURICE_006883 [Spodoptera frugiperda]
MSHTRPETTICGSHKNRLPSHHANHAGLRIKIVLSCVSSVSASLELCLLNPEQNYKTSLIQDKLMKT